MRSALSILLRLVVLISVTGACSEPLPPEPVPDPPPATPPAPAVNTAPRVYARSDVWVALPTRSSVLHGSAHDEERNIESYSWKKVSGPATYAIESPGSVQTKVGNLEEGTYQFELTATDKGGLTGKATQSIVVYEPRTPGANEFIFKNLECDCIPDWVDRLTYVIENFHAYVPAGTAFKVFLKVAGSTHWVEVPSPGIWNYSYQINGNRFKVEVATDYLPEPYGRVEVKITF